MHDKSKKVTNFMEPVGNFLFFYGVKMTGIFGHYSGAVKCNISQVFNFDISARWTFFVRLWRLNGGHIFGNYSVAVKL